MEPVWLLGRIGRGRRHWTRRKLFFGIDVLFGQDDARWRWVGLARMNGRWYIVEDVTKRHSGRKGKPAGVRCSMAGRDHLVGLKKALTAQQALEGMPAVTELNK
jgi:hypothetical protein